MKQVVLRDGQPLVVDAPAPARRSGSVLVANAASVISSGTERAAVAQGGTSVAARAARNPDLVVRAFAHVREHGVRKTIERVRSSDSGDTVLGYASAGTVLDTGGLADFFVGQGVACAGAGAANHAGVVLVPGNLVAAVPDGVDLHDAAFTTLGAVAMQGVRRAAPSLGERVGVLGLGLLGLLTIQILRAAGCTVFGVEPNAARRKLAETFGIEQVVPPDSAVEEVAQWSAGAGLDAVIVTAAARSSGVINDAVLMVRPKGHVVPVGDIGLDLLRAPLYEREADVLISTSYGPGRYEPLYENAGVDYPAEYVRWTENRNMVEFLRLLASGQVRVAPLVDLEVPVDRAGEAYESLKSSSPPLAAVISYPGARQTLEHVNGDTVNVPPLRIARPRSDAGLLRVGVIGPGSFMRTVHLPNVRDDKRARIVAVAARRPTTAIDVARRLGGGIEAASDWRIVAEHPEVDVVLVGTRHDSHAEIAAGALQAGKAVLLEKPLGLTRAEIDAVWRAGEGDRARLVIGFNRTLAPLSRRLKAELSQVTGPRQVIIRVNAPLRSDHWLNDPEEGGGRILGEGCHFFDYANYLCGRPLLVSGAAARETGHLRTVQSASVTVSYEDGSLATVHYSGLGPASLPKERIEVLAGGEAWVLDDFEQLRHYSATGSHVETAGRADKGHAALMRAFLAACREHGDYSPGLRAGYLAQSVALCALEAIASASTLPIEPPPAVDRSTAESSR